MSVGFTRLNSAEITDLIELNALKYLGATKSLDLPFHEARVTDTSPYSIQVPPFRLTMYSNLNEDYLLYDQSAVPKIWIPYVESFSTRGTADLVHVLVVTVKLNVKSVQITMGKDYGSRKYSPEIRNLK